jgi:hypothetical protein
MRRRRPLTPGIGAGDPDDDSASESTSYHSPGLETILRDSSGKPPPVVLDLGPPVAANLATLQRLTREIYILDLLRGHRIQETGPRSVGDRATDVLNKIPDQSSGTFDLVLAWDVLEYLTPSESAAIVSWLAAHASPGALLFAVFSTGGVIADDPSGYAIVNECCIERRPGGSGFRPGSALAPSDQERRLAPFQVIHSYVLRHGVREVVARMPTLDASPPPPMS